jgi:hypothetical protein
MIVVYVNSMEDTATFDAIYRDLNEDTIILHNPSRVEVENLLIERPTETLLLFGHGSSRGLFSHDFKGMLIDCESVPLLMNREIIGIWCYASLFGARYNLRGFFTYMFISNSQECVCNRCGYYTNNVIFEENRLFAERVNNLIREGTPLEKWVEILYESRNDELEFVNFNYGNLSYLDGDGTPQLIVEDNDKLLLAESYMFEDQALTDDEVAPYKDLFGKSE